MNTGIKVKFLNAAGEGIILSRLSGGKYKVLCSDGFEREFRESELLPEKEKESGVESKTRIPFGGRTFRPDEGVYLMAVPEDFSDLLGTNFSFYLFNNTEFYLSWLFFLGTRKARMFRGNGILEPGGSTLLLEDRPGSLETFSNFCFHLSLFKKTFFAGGQPEEVEFKLKTNKWLKQGAYELWEPKNAISLPHCLFLPEGHSSSLSGDIPYMEFKFKTGPSAKGVSQAPISKGEVPEFDLHIEEIRDDHRGMTAPEKLHFQLSYFRSCLEECLKGEVSRAIFIHGVGEGVLKEELMRVLRKEYPEALVSQASYSRYGFGAMEVHFP
jgi:hypothetical protein